MFEMDCKMNMRNYGYPVKISQNTNIEESNQRRENESEWKMKVVLNIFNLSDRPLRFLQIFFDKLSEGYNIDILIKSIFMNPFQNYFCCQNFFLI